MDATEEFTRWLRANNLHIYQAAFAEEGYDDLTSFSMIPEDEIEELCKTVNMKPGHRRKIPILVNQAKKDFERELKIKNSLKDAELSRRMREIEGEAKTNEDTDEGDQSKGSLPDGARRPMQLSPSQPNSAAAQISLPEGKR